MEVNECIGKEEERIPTQAIPITQARPINCSMNIKLIIFIGMHHKAHRSGLSLNWASWLYPDPLETCKQARQPRRRSGPVYTAVRPVFRNRKRYSSIC